jgi:hypothetical protein
VQTVNEWFTKGRVPQDSLPALAAALGCDVNWLLTGTGVAPRADSTIERDEYRSNPQKNVRWRWAPNNPDGNEDHGNSNAYTIPADLDTFVRETGQNISDARLAPGAQANYRFITLRGHDRSAFEAAFDWAGMKPHVEAAQSFNSKFGRRLAEGLKAWEGVKDLVLLRVEDRGTQGLTGEERREEGEIEHFVRFCRGNLMSEKLLNAGGSYGLGKAVNWRCSRISTVVVNSRLHKPTVAGQFSGRVFGRADLAFHELEDGDVSYFSGRGQFGAKVGEKTNSVWGNETLAEDLFVTRDTDDTGTSILIPGFHNPSDPTESVADMATGIRRAWEKWFWPALDRGDIIVAVEQVEGRGAVVHEPVTCTGASRLLVEALAKFNAGSVVEELVKPGDIVVKDVKLTMPRKRDGSQPEMEHSAKLIIRLSQDGDSLSNKIALYRKPGMVVEYLEIPESQTGGLPFHGMVLCGEAAGDAPEDVAAEEFLRASEPPAHDKWESTDELATTYMSGGIKAIRDFKESIRREVRNALMRSSPESEEGPECVKRLLQIGASPVAQDRPTARLEGQVEDGSWVVTASVTMANREKGWRFRPMLEFVGESGGLDPVRWSGALESVDGRSEIGPGNIVTVRQQGRNKNIIVRIKGKTDPSSQLVPANRSVVTMRFADMGKAPEGARS